jgi:hypothetical protein
MIVSMILTELGGFSTAAGHVGTRFEVGHDVSLLIPEVWCRLTPEEREPERLIAEGMLEKVEDFVHNGVSIPASRLGYRITRRFVRYYMARVFDNPGRVFSDEILKPELQDPEAFADGILHIAEAQQRVAKRYLDDGSYELACPPLRAIVSILANGDYEGHSIDSPEVRSMFTKHYLLASDWYKRRLIEQQDRDVQHWKQAITRLQTYRTVVEADELPCEIDLDERLAFAEAKLAEVESSTYVKNLTGTLGADPMRVSANDPIMIDRLAEA